MSGIVRIKDLDTAEELTSGDYLAVDSAGEGLRKVPLKPITDDISDLKSAIEEIEPGLSSDAKVALLACFAHVAWTDENGQTYYDALEDALNGSEAGLSAVFSQGTEKYYPFDSLNSLKDNLVVTYTDGEGQSSVVTSYTLSGTLSVGTSTITVTYNGLTATFTVTVENVSFTNNYAIGIDRKVNTQKYYAIMSENSLTARCKFTQPIKNRDYTITIVDTSKYVVAGYDLSDNTLTEVTVTGNVQASGYPMSTSTSPSWSTEWVVTGSYIWCSFKKLDGTDFTQTEIDNAYGTIYTVS